MSKMGKMKKVALAAGLMLSLTAGVATEAKATTAGYLSAPNQPGAGPTFTALFTSTGTPNSYSLLYTGTSLYGNTLPTLPPPTAPSGSGNVTGVTDSNLPTNDVYYNGSNLNLSLVASTGAENWTSSSINGTASGQIISNVYKVGSGSTMNGATPGELVFTYQFDVTSVSNSNINTTQATVALFNNPGAQLWTLGSGINVDSSGNYNPLGPVLSCPGCTQLLAPAISEGLIVVNSTNQTIETLADQFSPSLGADYISPQIFVASNAYFYTTGSLSLAGSGMAAQENVYVPGTPEPSTLVLLGSGLALITFMAFRKKENRIII